MSFRGSYHTHQQLVFPFDQANNCSFTRNGVPTPVAPDFSNLQAQWASITPSGVASKDYVAKLQVTPPACPAFTATGWNVDPSSPLPLVGAAGVTSGMPSGVPTGSITVSVNTNVTSAPGAPTASTSHTYISPGNPSSPSTTTEEASSATSEGAAGKTTPIPISINDIGLNGMVVALIAVGAGAMILL